MKVRWMTSSTMDESDTASGEGGCHVLDRSRFKGVRKIQVQYAYSR